MRVVPPACGDLWSRCDFDWHARSRWRGGRLIAVWLRRPVMKVMYVGHTAQLSGGEIALSRLIAALGDSVEPVVVLGENGPLEGRLRELGVDVHILPLVAATKDLRKDRVGSLVSVATNIAAVLAYAWRLRRLMREQGVAVVHTNTLKAGFYGCLAARWAGIPSVWHVRDRLAPDYLPRLAIMLTRTALAVLPQRIICNSAATKSTVAPKWAGWVASKAVVAASPIPDVLDAARNRPVTAVRSGGGLVVGMVGRFAPWKGQLIVIRAFAAADLPKSRLILIGSPMFGEDAYSDAVLEEIRALGLEDRVEVRGFVDDVLGALPEMDVLVHASLSPEPFGQVIVEGLAVGIPVVATRGGGPSEILTHEVDGLLYEPGDVEELTGLLRRLDQEPELRTELGHQGARRARDFSPAVIGPLVLGVYEQLSRSPRRRITR